MVFGVFIYTKFSEYRAAPSSDRGRDGSQETSGKEMEHPARAAYLTVEVR